ncbi:MAG: regulatory protein RecX [Tepidisphaeraceae bacterium]
MFDPEKKKKFHSPAEAYLKIRSYCAYQERSHKEVRNKLFEYGLHTNEVDEIISRIITDGFLNEERFAKAYAGGKFRIKKWGRNKIVRELEVLGVTPRCIRAGLKEIDDSDYRKSLREIIRKKLAQTHEANAFKKRDKVARFVIGKGYEPEAVWEILKED